VNREKTHNNKQYIYSTWFHRLQITRQEFFDALGSGLYTVFPTSVWESMDPLGFWEIYYERQWISYKVWDNIVGNYDLLASLMESKWKRLISINELIKIFPNLKNHFMT
jgi:hypothetical protein